MVRDEYKRPTWARIEVRDSGGKMYQPTKGPQIIRDLTAHNFPGNEPYYLGHVVALGEVTLEVPAADYQVIVERGLEYTRVDKHVTVLKGKKTRVDLSPRRWVNMNERGWWSADFHVHRPIEDILSLIQAEDLNLAVVFTMWNKRNLWEVRRTPADPILRADSVHMATVMNAEDERGGGAWMFHDLKQPLQLGVQGRWFPPGKVFVEQARAQRAWFDMEKPFWWEVPVMMAFAPPDSWGVVNNHFQQYGIYDSEAWGRPRNRQEFSGFAGFVANCLQIYYKYLNLGFKIPASAGSASGVVPNPVGQNRTYAYLGSNTVFHPNDYYEAMRQGRTFASNGPMLLFRINACLPGGTLEIQPLRSESFDLTAIAREPIDRVELIANGEVVFSNMAGVPTKKVTLSGRIDLNGHTWVIARCFLKPGPTIRLAHTGPIYLSGPQSKWDASSDAYYFVQWMDELIATCRSDSVRFQNDAERNTVLSLYDQARKFYANLARTQ